jgi:NDP-sugar pyrophosphorylase family protein
MILAAGYGTRLWPLTIDRAKPAIPFMGKPLVGYVAEYLAEYGCRDVVVNLHHRPDSVRRALGDGEQFGVHLVYVEEPTILGTSGALDNARTLLEKDTLIVVNGKIATDIDLDAALDTHRSRNALATLVVRANRARERYSTVDVVDGNIKGFGPAPTPVREDDEEAEPLMFTGIQILEPRIFDYIPRGVFSHSTTDVYPQAIARGEAVIAHVASGDWYELSTVERYLETSLALMSKEKRDVEVGEGSLIDESAHVSQSVLWENVRVGKGAKVRRAILGAGVTVAPDERIENVAVVRAELVRGSERPPKGLGGEFQGSNFVAPLAQ